MPPSPRSQRHPSFTGIAPAAVQDLLSVPPANKAADSRFAGRDWRDIQLGELASLSDVKWVTMDTCVEEATMVMHPGSPPASLSAALNQLASSCSNQRPYLNHRPS